MLLPIFFEEDISDQSSFVLTEETSKHIIQVLRMKKGEQIQLTNGKGKIINAEIISEHKKSTEIKVISTSNITHRTSGISIAISLVKNNSRFEWFLEKATEIGVSEIIPLLCERTEKQNFRHDRMKNILISAMLQSQQAWLPKLHQPTKFNEIMKTSQPYKFIAHCDEDKKVNLTNVIINKNSATSKVLPNGEPARITGLDGDLGGAIILIGPEGDFTKQEIDLAVRNDFIPVSLGATRLRTETAGIVAAVLLNQK